MIKFDEIDLLAFFETDPVPDPDEPTILRYSVATKTGMDLVFTIDSPLRCTHLLMSINEIVLVDAGTEGVVQVDVIGKGDHEILECEVETATVVGKVTISWKATPHLRTYLLDRNVQ